MRVLVVILECELNDCTEGKDEWVGVLAVNGWIVNISCRSIHGSVQGWDFLWEVVDAVQVGSVLAIGIGTKADGHLDGICDGPKFCLLVPGSEN